MNILIFGPNGSGKGTQGALLMDKYGVAHIESGAVFRQHVGSGTELGKKAKEYMDRGELVPDEITIPMILDILGKQGDKGWLLDGFPRNMEQARKLHEALDKAGMRLDYVVEIQLPRETAKQRIMGRRLCAVNNNHPNNIHIDAIKPVGDACGCAGARCRPRGRSERRGHQQTPRYLLRRNQRHSGRGRYFKKLAAADPKTTYIELDGSGSIDDIRNTLLAQLH